MRPHNDAQRINLQFHQSLATHKNTQIRTCNDAIGSSANILFLALIIMLGTPLILHFSFYYAANYFSRFLLKLFLLYAHYSFMEDDQLFRSLLPNTTAAAAAATGIKDDDNLQIFSSNSNVILRLCSLFFIGIISLWANSAASRGFEITIINDIKDSAASNRFTLFYISNDKATRIIQNSSSFVQNVLYPNHNFTMKKIEHVTLRLTASAATNFNEFVINLSPSQIMGDPKKLDYLVKSMVLQGIARIWLWNSREARAPPWFLDGLVEYIHRIAGYGGDGLKLLEFGNFCLGDKDPRSVAQFLDYCEGIREGFIQRLNQGLKDGWDDQTVENALGMPVKNVCNYFSNSSKSNGFSSI